ncbi:hypothetical protein [Nocardioides sp. zg-1230]|uniref:hypothetical protein n=1 Tax=Nocardioides sp. zg-1230 TaxID=2736601 RepID=UPI0015555D6A|nr:hypothetical protein [Nocardioides sp. zg-1230]NPC43552.1 hypothetical protein [Nocardioides sp. zg-1230]
MTSKLERPAAADVATPAGTTATVLFMRMWAIAHVIHLVAADASALATPWSIATVGLAVVVVLRPDGRLFLAMMVAQAADYVAEMPGSPDHWAFILLVNLAIGLTMLVRRSTGPQAVAAAFPGVRAIALVVYGFAALSKYNTHFLDPVTSCANAIAGRASYGLTAPVQDTLLLPVASLLMETSVPLLLALPLTRRHWVRVAMLFHFTLSISPAFSVVDFTSALFAIFVLFLSDEEVDRVLAVFRAVASRSAIARDARRMPPVTAFLAFAVFGFIGYASPILAAALVFVAAQLYLLAVLIAALWTWRRPAQRRPFGRPMLVHVPVLVLAVLWGLSPYLGLRTTGVFTMFSGVQTEGQQANHLLLPTSHLTTWQEELVTIRGSNDPVLAGATKYDLAIPLLALRRMAQDDPDLTVAGIVEGRPVEFGPGEGQVDLAPLPYWQYKLLHFRPIPLGDKPFCSIS